MIAVRPGAFTERRRYWRQAAVATLDRRVLALSLLGFSAGLPFLLIFGTLGLWLREAGFERGDVTYFSWAALQAPASGASRHRRHHKIALVLGCGQLDWR